MTSHSLPEPPIGRTTSTELAILFWYYKDIPTCKSRIIQLRKQNPALPIYGLYGGEIDNFPSFETELSPLLDDNWCFPDAVSTHWKWKRGEQLIIRWFKDRGQQLRWESIFIAQWDMLPFAPIDRYLGPFEKDTLYLPGLEPIEKLYPHWWWVRQDSAERLEFDAFKAHMQTAHEFAGPYHGCQFLSATMPRRFIGALSELAMPDFGFLEYTLPAYASLTGITLRGLPNLRLTWNSRHKKTDWVTMTAEKYEIRPLIIFIELLKPTGARFFHPTTKPHRFLNALAGALKR